MLVALTDVYISGGGSKEEHNPFYGILGKVRAKIAGRLHECEEVEKNKGLEYIKQYKPTPESKHFISISDEEQTVIINELLENEKKKWKRTRGEMSAYILHKYNVRITLEVMRHLIKELS